MPAVKGTIDFQYDFDHDLVVAKPRWSLDTSAEVMRWYQLHASYFAGRFGSPKDLITVNDDFDVAPKVATLWGSYRAKLQERWVRSSVHVRNNARVRLTTNTSGVRYSVSSVECATVEEAIAAILAVREAKGTGRPSSEIRALVPSSTATPAIIHQEAKAKK
jgi:hypothetical protein